MQEELQVVPFPPLRLRGWPSGGAGAVRAGEEAARDEEDAEQAGQARPFLININ